MPASTARSRTVPTATAAAPALSAFAHGGGGRDAARGDERQGDRLPYLAEQVGEGDGRRNHLRGQGAGVAASGRGLHDERVGARLRRQASLRGRGDRLDDHASGVPQRGDDGRLRQAEREAYDRHGVGKQQVDLVPPAVVVLDDRGLAQVDAVVLRLAVDGTGIAAERLRVDRNGVGREEVYPERHACAAERRDVFGQRVRGLVAAGQEAEAPCPGRGGDQPGRGRGAGHRRGQHRHVRAKGGEQRRSARPGYDGTSRTTSAGSLSSRSP